MGYAGLSDLVVAPPSAYIDFGVRREGFCADLQRMWYVRPPGETEPPKIVMQTWAGVRRALLAGAEALRPGRRGWEVDQAARSTIVAGGLPEYKHAFGHQLGRATHDGAFEILFALPMWSPFDGGAG
jgi:Xaa-Pro aminopeptidase